MAFQTYSKLRSSPATNAGILPSSVLQTTSSQSRFHQISSHRTFRRPLVLFVLCATLYILYSTIHMMTGTLSSPSRIQLNDIPTKSTGLSDKEIKESSIKTTTRFLERVLLKRPILYNHNRGINDTAKMEFVRDMMKYAWRGYMEYAKDADELNAAYGTPHFWNDGQSQYHTPVDALDTLWIMGMKKEYHEAKHAVLESMDFYNWTSVDISVFETTIRTLGGLLSAYDLEGDPQFLKKAVSLADLLLHSFSEETNGIPLNKLNVTGRVASGNWGLRSAYLAEYGTLQLEFQYLSDVTGNATYQEKTLRLFDLVHEIPSPIPGLYPTQLNVDSLTFMNNQFGIGAMADSFYEYLLKLWLSTGESRFRDMFEESADAIIEHLLTFSPGRKVSYLPDLNYGQKSFMVHHLTCFAGGWFALGALSRRSHKTGLYLDVAHKITHGCYTMYGNMSDSVGFEESSVTSDAAELFENPVYFLRPELIESLVYMYRFTHDEIYREWGWKIAQAIERHCKTRFGYQGLPRNENENQESFFLAETLKYLFLLFTDDNVLAFEEYVFNTEAHPLSIRGFGRRADPTKWVPIKSNYYNKSTSKIPDPVPVSPAVGKIINPDSSLATDRK